MYERVKRIVALTQIGALTLSLVVTGAAPATAVPSPTPALRAPATTMPPRPTALAESGRAPLWFEPNVGQVAPHVKFLGRLGAHRLMLTDRGALLDVRSLDTRKATKPGQLVSRSAKSKAKFEAAKKGKVLGGVVRMEPVGARMTTPVAEQRLQGVSHYYSGKDRTKWKTGVPHYGRVRYAEVYPGIDLVYYGSPRTIEYDFIVRPGADPRAIRIALKGADRTELLASGDLLVTVNGVSVRQRKPNVYQDVAGVRTPVEGRYVLSASGEVRFEVGRYVASLPLVIDPEVDLGNGDVGFSEVAAGDGSGNSYVTGVTFNPPASPIPGTPCADEFVAPDFTPGSDGLPDFPDVATDAFLVKLSPTNTILWVAFLGGRSGGESDCSTSFGNTVVLDAAGANVFVGGSTNSANFAITVNAGPLQSPNAFQATLADDQAAFGGDPFNFFGGDGFVAKLSATGTLTYASYIGGVGHDFVQALAVDSAGNLHVTGGTDSMSCETPPFLGGTSCYPFTVGGTAGGGYSDVFVAKVSPTGTLVGDPVYYTLQGGAGDDSGVGISVSASNVVTVTGDTIVECVENCEEGFARLEDGLGVASLLGSQALGGELHLAGIEAGLTLAPLYPPNDFPGPPLDSTLTKGAQGGIAGDDDPANAFLLMLDGNGTGAVASSFIVGGSGVDIAAGVAVDAFNNVYLAGQTSSANFRRQNDVTGPNGLPDQGIGTTNGYVIKLAAPATATAAPSMLMSSKLGGDGDTLPTSIAVTRNGEIYLTGVTTSTTGANVVPTVPSGTDAIAFLVRIPAPTTPTAAPQVTTTDQVVVSSLTAVDGFVAAPPLSVATDTDGNAIVAGLVNADPNNPAPTLGLKFTRPAIEVTMDIKPRAKKNNINLKTKTVQVAILSTPAFDASTRVDRASIRFGHTVAVPDDPTTEADEAVHPENSLVLHRGVPKCWTKTRHVELDDPATRKIERVKVKDLVCRFSVQAAAFEKGDTAGYLTASTVAGTAIIGGRRASDGTFIVGDVVHIVPPKKGDKDRDCDDDDEDWRDDDDDHHHHAGQRGDRDHDRDDRDDKGKGKK